MGSARFLPWLLFIHSRHDGALDGQRIDAAGFVIEDFAVGRQQHGV